MTTYPSFNADTQPLEAKQESEIVFAKNDAALIPPAPKHPAWRVYFKGNFWGHSGRERAGLEIPTKTQFLLNHSTWHIPSIYSCSKGLVVDFCVQIPIESIRNFISKWELSVENDGSNFTEAQQLQAEAENPLAIDVSTEIILNGKVIPCPHSCSLSWNPCFAQHNGIKSERVLAQYGLDPDCGWVVLRCAFPWLTTRRPKISSLQVTIKHKPALRLGSHFRVSTPGDAISFSHPITGTEHTLTIQEYEQQKMTEDRFSDDSYAYPTHFTAMCYTLCPDLAGDSFSLRDCSEGDRPRKKRTSPAEPQATASCMAVIVGGASDRSTAAPFGGQEQGVLRSVCSALHFEPVDAVEWQTMFYKKPCEDMTIKVI